MRMISLDLMIRLGGFDDGRLRLRFVWYEGYGKESVMVMLVRVHLSVLC